MPDLLQPIDNASAIENPAALPWMEAAENLPNRSAESRLRIREKGILVSGPWISDARTSIVPNNETKATFQDEIKPDTRPTIQPLFVDVARENVKVQALQRWTGRVERVAGDSFVALLFDTTTPSNPAQEVELDIGDVSPPDRPLIDRGAVFYWVIAYRTTKGGQRTRVSSIRFARQAKLSANDINEIFAEADEVADLLESA